MIADIGKANHMIQEKGLGSDRHCYLGKRLLPAIEVYRAFSHQGNHEYFRIQQAPDASEITDGLLGK